MAPPIFLLRDRAVLVTGGARGLGAAIASTLAAAGAQVVIADLDGAGAEAQAAQLRATGSVAEALQLDVGAEADVNRAMATLRERHGKLDVLVNNAAIDVTLPIEELSVEQWDAVLRTNLRGPFLLSRAAAALMKTQGSGHIVNITSTAARRAWPNAAAYHASKWGLLGLSHALHAELRPQGIKVTAVLAGGMRTPFLLDRFPDIDLANLQDPANVAQVVLWSLCLPEESVMPEVMVLPMRETSWP
ncbi:MAG TPA: SDR family oxidoreductase [Gammaproteobacteria bacterium]|mgnify:CR=1 FL=1|nr:SDR family oxidoreductase [Gammaproteobacteria bacterium]